MRYLRRLLTILLHRMLTILFQNLLDLFICPTSRDATIGFTTRKTLRTKIITLLLTARGHRPKPVITMRIKLPFFGEFRLFESAIDLGAAARRGTLSRVPPELLTEEALTVIGGEHAPIHLAAMFGHLDQIPEERLTPAVMAAPSKDKLNALHYAAREDHLDQVPIRFFTPGLLGDNGHAEWSPAHEIAARKEVSFVPEAFFTQEVLTSKSRCIPPGFPFPIHSIGISVIEMCVRGGLVDALPSSALTPEVMTAPACGVRATAMHIIAETGRWNNVPANLLNAATLLHENASGQTPLHYAAQSGKLREIPERLFSEAAVLKQNNVGDTPLHHAARGRNISQFPPEFLTRENLSVVNDRGHSVYHCLAGNGTLGDLPPGALDRSDLWRRDNYGVTPLGEAAAMGTLDAVPPGMFEREDLEIGWRAGSDDYNMRKAKTDCGHKAPLAGVFPILPAASSFSLPAEPQADADVEIRRKTFLNR
jgi:hypothetical protein